MVLTVVWVAPACASNHVAAGGSGHGPPAASTTTAVTATTTSPVTGTKAPSATATASTAQPSRTFSAPHIRCEAGTVRHAYVASVGNPPELCLVTGATATIRIATGAVTWPPLRLAGAKTLRITSSTAARGTTSITVLATGTGVARIVSAARSQWTLTVAVIS